ncbi:hypothetical protein HK099_000831, partial [Clydaea vesicula]
PGRNRYQTTTVTCTETETETETTCSSTPTQLTVFSTITTTSVTTSTTTSTHTLSVQTTSTTTDVCLGKREECLPGFFRLVECGPCIQPPTLTISEQQTTVTTTIAGPTITVTTSTTVPPTLSPIACDKRRCLPGYIRIADCAPCVAIPITSTSEPATIFSTVLTTISQVSTLTLTSVQEKIVTETLTTTAPAELVSVDNTIVVTVTKTQPPAITPVACNTVKCPPGLVRLAPCAPCVENQKSVETTTLTSSTIINPEPKTVTNFAFVQVAAASEVRKTLISTVYVEVTKTVSDTVTVTETAGNAATRIVREETTVSESMQTSEVLFHFEEVKETSDEEFALANDVKVEEESSEDGSSSSESTATVEYESTATVGYESTATVGYESTATEGYESTENYYDESECIIMIMIMNTTISNKIIM